MAAGWVEHGNRKERGGSLRGCCRRWKGARTRAVGRKSLKEVAWGR